MKNKKAFLIMFGFLFALTLSLLYAAQNDISTWEGSGTLDGVDAIAFDSDGDINVYQGDIQLGQSGNRPDDATANTYPGITVPIYNASGVTISQGMVIVASATATTDGYGSVVSLTSTSTILGVAYEDISDGSVGDMVISGWGVVLTSGTVGVGDLLTSTATAQGYAGKIAPAGTVEIGSVVGRAMGTGTATGGLTLALIGVK